MVLVTSVSESMLPLSEFSLQMTSLHPVLNLFCNYHIHDKNNYLSKDFVTRLD